MCAVHKQPWKKESTPEQQAPQNIKQPERVKLDPPTSTQKEQIDRFRQMRGGEPSKDNKVSDAFNLRDIGKSAQLLVKAGKPQDAINLIRANETNELKLVMNFESQTGKDLRNNPTRQAETSINRLFSTVAEAVESTGLQPNFHAQTGKKLKDLPAEERVDYYRKIMQEKKPSSEEKQSPKLEIKKTDNGSTVIKTPENTFLVGKLQGDERPVTVIDNNGKHQSFSPSRLEGQKITKGVYLNFKPDEAEPQILSAAQQAQRTGKQVEEGKINQKGASAIAEILEKDGFNAEAQSIRDKLQGSSPTTKKREINKLVITDNAMVVKYSNEESRVISNPNPNQIREQLDADTKQINELIKKTDKSRSDEEYIVLKQGEDTLLSITGRRNVELFREKFEIKK